MNWRAIRNAGYALLLGPASGGIYQLLEGFNWAVFCVSLVLLTLSLSLIAVGHLGHHHSGRGVELISPESSAQNRICELVTHPDVASVDFISAGVSSRKGLLLRLVKEFRIPIRVLVQDPQIAVSNAERVSTIKALYDIATEIGHDRWNSPDVQFQFYDDRASLRAALFRDRNGTTVYAVLGWYTYRAHNTALSGSRHPSISITKSATPLLRFAEDQFSRRWTDGDSLDYETIEALGSQIQ